MPSVSSALVGDAANGAAATSPAGAGARVQAHGHILVVDDATAGAERGEAQHMAPALQLQRRRIGKEPVDEPVDLARIARDEAARLDDVAPRRRLQLGQAELPAL